MPGSSADRFYVVRLIHHHFMDLCRQIAPAIRQHRGYLGALREHREWFTALQQKRLSELLAGKDESITACWRDRRGSNGTNGAVLGLMSEVGVIAGERPG